MDMSHQNNEFEEYALYDSHTGELLDRGSYENIMSALIHDFAITQRNLDDYVFKMLVAKDVVTIMRNDFDTQLHEFVKKFGDVENGNGRNRAII